MSHKASRRFIASHFESTGEDQMYRCKSCSQLLNGNYRSNLLKHLRSEAHLKMIDPDKDDSELNLEDESDDIPEDQPEIENKFKWSGTRSSGENKAVIESNFEPSDEDNLFRCKTCSILVNGTYRGNLYKHLRIVGHALDKKGNSKSIPWPDEDNGPRERSRTRSKNQDFGWSSKASDENKTIIESNFSPTGEEDMFRCKTCSMLVNGNYRSNLYKHMKTEVHLAMVNPEMLEREGSSGQRQRARGRSRRSINADVRWILRDYIPISFARDPKTANLTPEQARRFKYSCAQNEKYFRCKACSELVYFTSIWKHLSTRKHIHAKLLRRGKRAEKPEKNERKNAVDELKEMKTMELFRKNFHEIDEKDNYLCKTCVMPLHGTSQNLLKHLKSKAHLEMAANDQEPEENNNDDSSVEEDVEFSNLSDDEKETKYESPNDDQGDDDYIPLEMDMEDESCLAMDPIECQEEKEEDKERQSEKLDSIITLLKRNDERQEAILKVLQTISTTLANQAKTGNGIGGD